MRDDSANEESKEGLVARFRSIRRREVLFQFFCILFWLVGSLAVFVTRIGALGLCVVGGALGLAALSMRQERLLTQEKLSSAGPTAIGPLIEALYFDRRADEEIISDARVQTAAEIVRLLGSAPRQQLLTLTDQEAEYFYRPYANWSDDFPEYQSIVLDHLIACVDVRAIRWVARLIKTPSFSNYSSAVKQRAIICHDLLMEKYTREKTSSVLLRSATESPALLRPTDGSSNNSKVDSLLLHPSLADQHGKDH